MIDGRLALEPHQIIKGGYDVDLPAQEDQQIQDGVNELVAILFEHWLEQQQKAREEKSSNQPNAPDTS